MGAGNFTSITKPTPSEGKQPPHSKTKVAPRSLNALGDGKQLPSDQRKIEGFSSSSMSNGACVAEKDLVGSVQGICFSAEPSYRALKDAWCG